MHPSHGWSNIFASDHADHDVACTVCERDMVDHGYIPFSTSSIDQVCLPCIASYRIDTFLSERAVSIAIPDKASDSDICRDSRQ